jgi:hypothetical protein
MYIDGMPILKVQNHLRQHDSTKVSDVSILNWVKRYAHIKKDLRAIQANNKREDTY